MTSQDEPIASLRLGTIGSVASGSGSRDGTLVSPKYDLYHFYIYIYNIYIYISCLKEV